MQDSRGQHEDAGGGEAEDSEREDESDDADATLLEFRCGICEEEDCGEEDRIAKILPGKAAGLKGLLHFCCSRRIGFGGFAGAAHLIKVRHERMWIGFRVFKRLLRE